MIWLEHENICYRSGVFWYYGVMNTLMVLVLVALSLVSVGLFKSYRHVSERELRRRARQGDELAAALYRAVAYGPSLGAVLWLCIVATNASLFVVLAQNSPTWFAIIASAAVIWFAFVWLPARDVTRFSTWLAVKVAPFLAWLLTYIHPLLSRLTAFVDKHKPVTIHTGLYDIQDLLDLVEAQKVQPDSRIEKFELDLAVRALSFGDKYVRDVLVPRRVVKMVSAQDTVGPVLMSELHESGFSRFPVYDGKKDNIVGILYIKDLVQAKAGGHIDKVMRADVSYVHEDQPLVDALQAIIKTRRHQFIVVNGFEEYVGIITMEDVLEQIIGTPIFDEFDQYDDLRAVAARQARKEHQEHVQPSKAEEKPAEISSETDEKVVK